MGCADSSVSMKPAPANSLTETEPGLVFPAAAEQEEWALLPASTHTTAARHKHEVLVRPGSRLVLVLVLIMILWITPIQQTTRKKGFHKMKPRIECNSIFQTKKTKKLSRYESGYLPKDSDPDSLCRHGLLLQVLAELGCFRCSA
jgi:hypothetical protein